MNDIKTNPFSQYLFWVKDDKGQGMVNENSLKYADEAFGLFKSLYNKEFGSIEENGNLVSIHTGGWYDNEVLIDWFMETGWWFKCHEITAKGGHYFFNTDINGDKEWRILAK